MTIKFELADVEANFGTAEALAERVAAFTEAVKAHATTENVPAPTEHPAIERIVRQFKGKYDVILPPEPRKPPEPKLVELQAIALAQAAQLRWSLGRAGIIYNGLTIATDSAARAEMLAILMTIPPLPADGSPDRWSVGWKLANGEYVDFNRHDIQNIVTAQREHVQRAFDNERELSETIIRTKSKKQVVAIDIEEGILK